MPPFKMVWRNLLRRPLRSVLTILSLTVAIFLICALSTLITTLTSGIEHADSRRLAVMSANGLFVELPMRYQQQLERVAGVEQTTKFQWFGGYFRSQQNFFGQFAVDGAALLDMYPECQVAPEQRAAFLAGRTACLIGDGLARKYRWKIGDTIPLIGALHPHPEDKAWEFQVAGIYHSDVPNFDSNTMYFNWAYFEETLKRGDVPPSVGVFSVRVAPGTDIDRFKADVEDMFATSEQRVQCFTEAEFQRQFVSMMGNLPLFVGWIGSGVLIAILLACINTMLMAGREQTPEIGIMKSLGFTDASMFAALIAQGLTLCVLGGGLGMLLAWSTQDLIAHSLGANFPGFVVTPGTFARAALVTLGVGLVAGAVPAWRAARLRCVEALRGTD